MKIVLNDTYPIVRKAALERITKPELFAQIAGLSRDIDIRMTAIPKVVDQKVLEKIAQEYPVSDVSLSALKEISDQQIVSNFLLHYSSTDIIRIAANKLTDETILTQPAIQKNMIRIFEDTDDLQLKQSIFTKLSDNGTLLQPKVQLLIAHLMVESGKQGWTKKAQDILYDPEALGYVAVTSSDRESREYAVKKLKDSTQLFNLALMSSDGYIRQLAILKLDDQLLLGKVALQSNDYHIRRSAAAKITDTSVLSVLQGDNDSEVRAAAKKRLSEPRH
jgi:hypothetical protein